MKAPQITRSNARSAGRWALATLLLAAFGYVGGVGMTSLFPTTVETKFYSADVRMGLVPDSTVRLPTLLGDVSVGFDGPLPAPGIIVDAQLRKDVTEAFAGRTPTPAQFQPSPAELDTAARAGLTGVAWRFVLGLALTAGALLVARRAWRNPRASLVTAAGALALSLVAPALTGYVTYHERHIGEVRTTSLLSMARNDLSILTDLEKRTSESSRYITSVLALSSALQTKYAPRSTAAPTALRVMFVSDIHGTNQYALMRDIIRSERVDVVVDAGDLINFGSVREAEAAGIFRSIERLGVPYLFVRGNHDATSATDTALLDRMSKVPNVVTLQPNSRLYTKVTMAGVTFGGFNDRRFYGDGDPKDKSIHSGARKHFLSTWKDNEVPAPDVVVSHEPGAVEDGFEDDQLLISGHTHTPHRDGNWMTVGTFTGGGLFGARLAQGAEKGTEVQTQAYSFDIAEFDTGCSLTTMRRYTFTGILQGRPELQSTNVLSGRQFVPEAADDRQCAGPVEPVTVPVRGE
ncbi:metallophosphoesterase [Yimella sp. RIT 621]|uniref:metallophosphoesterase family protein n=1 Tax=Yimella sp. RIT 621 TaxID=2510323 RepID=UPI00101CA0E0|nr:metallophosphoesterase [Yimella sp. RIT 621]RYG78473.1 metallophosphoesterase [Yimella sp. RIT 621]